MLIRVQTKRRDITRRKRQIIEDYARRVFARQRWPISHCSITIAPAVGGDAIRWKCHIRLWSARLGSIGVCRTGDTIRTAVQQAAIRAREVLRRRLHKRRARARRPGRNRIARWLTPSAFYGQ
jgi:hypothetical protein